MYIDLVADPNAEPRPIHLGLRSETRALLNYIKSLEAVGINHLAPNLRFNRADVEMTMRRLADELMPMLAV